MNYELRGRCKELASEAVRLDPTLTLVRGWYNDPVEGKLEHWWTMRPDGSIHDPTAAQFRVPNIEQCYEPFTGLYPCMECGTEVLEDDLYHGATCSSKCYGRMVGVPYG